ncbi:MAG: hypothetical protein ACRD00_07140 [Thermoanaerobaculia bacterium]
MKATLALTPTLSLAWLLPLAAVAPPGPEPTPAPSAGWPGSLSNGLPAELRGYATAPKDPLPDTDENEMGVYTQVSRRYQQIQSRTFARALVFIVQDYGSGKNLTASLRSATREAGKNSGVLAREQSVGGRPAFVVFHRDGEKPVTVVTVLATPSRLLLAYADNIEEPEALKLVEQVDFKKIAAAR